MSARRPIDDRLLWEAIVWTQYSYAKLSQEEQRLRPQRPYEANDGKTLAPLIRDVRRAYYTAKRTHGSAARFDDCKKAVLNTWVASASVDSKTRNFYSSVISTYITWDSHTQSTETKQLLASLSPLCRYLQQRG